jgi:hypothetical protein
MMRGFFLASLILAVVAASGACGKSEKSGPAPVSEASSAAPDSHPPIAALDNPKEGSTVSNKSWGTGWALDDSGIFQVTATADGGAPTPAQIGQAFPGVREAYPNLPDNEKAGFIFGLPDLPPGPHTLRVEVVAKDGGKVVLTRSFNVL